jgi:enamine deaminase RidA (YjgF/YER057c/UK114 family)
VQAIKAGNTLYVSGQIGIVPGTKDFASEGVEGQTEQVRRSKSVCRCVLCAVGSVGSSSSTLVRVCARAPPQPRRIIRLCVLRLAPRHAR